MWGGRIIHAGVVHGSRVSGDATRVWRSTEASGCLLVCVSGLGGTADEWIGVGPALSGHGEVIAVELTLPPPGTGHGGGPLQSAVRALDQVLRCCPERPVLIGHSMGAVGSMVIAASRPDRLGGLVLTAPFVPVGRNGRPTWVTAADYARHRVLFAAGARGRRRQRVGLPTLNTRKRVAGLRALAHYGLRPATFHAMADRVTCPVLLVHGSEDHYVPPAFALAAAARHPSWQVALISGAGHFAHRDEATTWLSMVDPWLQRLRPP